MCISLKVCKKKQLTFAIVVIIQHLFVFSAHFNTCLCLSLLFVCEFCLKDTLEHTISVRTLFKLMPLMKCKATKEALGGFFVIILPFTLLIQINLMVVRALGCLYLSKTDICHLAYVYNDVQAGL